MLDFYFVSLVRRRLLRRGPVADHLDGLAAQLQGCAYARFTARRILSIAGQFSCYAGLAGVAAQDIDDRLVDRFLTDGLAGQGLQYAPTAMRHLMHYLRKAGVIATMSATQPKPPANAATLEGLEAHLRDVRGLAATTRARYQATAQAFFEWNRGRHGRRALRRLTGADVLEFTSEHLGVHPSQSWRGHLCSNMRGLLRYLHPSGTTASDLSRAVPRVSTPRLATLPRRLPWEQVRALIDGVDASHPVGKRDKAILLLLGTLGLRGYEVRTLELANVAWRAGEIRLPRTKTRRERVLPLGQEVGAALADYVLHGRPRVSVAQVFLRHMAPPGPLTSSEAVPAIVRRALARAGMRVGKGAGAHMLRHSLATRMVNAGVSIKAVADLLGHASIDMTAIYTKVDMAT